jgi:anti-sigma regulatory factor (Ser/Thr protein kinase)
VDPADKAVERVAVDRLVPGRGPGAVGRCRDFVRASLTDHGWLEDADAVRGAVVEDVLLMTSELVTNACLYAGGPIELVVAHARRGRVRVEVVDASPRAPGMRPPATPARPGGHGLRVVQRLACRWGSEARSGGKVVWFEAERAEASG